MFVTLEGIDGSGKSTCAAAVAAALAARGARVEVTREPTSSWLGQAVRAAIRDEADPLGLALLFLADRAGHAHELAAWRAAGRTVVCDRYADSTTAYQAAALEGRLDRPLETLRALQASRFPVPDVTLWLDVPVEVALARVGARRGARESFEEAAFLGRVRANYARLAALEPGRFVRVDASGTAAEVAGACVEAVAARAPKV